MFNSPLTAPQEVRTIKYGTLLGILLVSFLVILGMWFHANQRMKKGLPPLRYHRVRIYSFQQSNSIDARATRVPVFRRLTGCFRVNSGWFPRAGELNGSRSFSSPNSNSRSINKTRNKKLTTQCTLCRPQVR